VIPIVPFSAALLHQARCALDRVSEHLTDTASDWSWVILAFYVPVLWVAAVLTFWQIPHPSERVLAALT
jgi:hypothetical protein